MKSERYKKILEKNKKFEKESPYNFCDRWCERCTHEKQVNCRLYLDDLERRVTCIAHGKDEDDPEITEKVMHEQYKDIDEKLEETAKKFNVDLDDLSDLDESDFDEDDRVEFEDLPKEIQEHIKFVKNNPLPPTAERYCDKAHEFLNTFDEVAIKAMPKDLRYHFDTVVWYHTLLPAKMQRAIAGFHEPVSEGEFALYDAVAQFEICQKSCSESIKALRYLKTVYSQHQQIITELIAILHNINSRVEAILESV